MGFRLRCRRSLAEETEVHEIGNEAEHGVVAGLVVAVRLGQGSELFQSGDGVFGKDAYLTLFVVFDLFRSSELPMATRSFNWYPGVEVGEILFDALIAAIHIERTAFRQRRSEVALFEQAVIMPAPGDGVTHVEDESFSRHGNLGFERKAFLLARMVLVPFPFLFRTRDGLFRGIGQDLVEVRDDGLQFLKAPDLLSSALPWIFPDVLFSKEWDDGLDRTADRAFIHAKEVLEDKEDGVHPGPDQDQEELISERCKSEFPPAA